MKKNIFLAVSFILVFLAGTVSVRVWDAYKTALAEEQAASAPSQVSDTDSLFIANMDGATTPEGVEVIEEPSVVDDSAIPSQLTKIKLEGVAQVVSRTGTVVKNKEEENDNPVQLPGDDLVPSQTGTLQQIPATESKISMIEAPAKVKLIKSSAEYKAFKRVARGSYPAANFKEDYIVVLESTSNLPDKVFEIQDVVLQDGKMVVIYRVNIFGLDGKTNTHTAVRIAKTDLPIELKQVL